MKSTLRPPPRTNGTTMSKLVRVAVYTRKSTDEGLDQAFNSLDAQRQAVEAFVASQRGEGWQALPERYDDGGFSGANTARPAFQRLLKDIAAGRVDVIAVYKIDRLSRSLLDFMQLMKLFEQHGVTFVSVTQQFNTTTSAGRFTLNLLASFAEFERAMISERTRDKMSATRRKGMRCGGPVPFGYSVVDKKLVIDEPEAARVREIFAYFLDRRSIMSTVEELNRRGWQTKTGKPWDTSAVRRLLRSAVYSGQVEYQGELYPGAHQAIVEPETWSAACDALRDSIERHRSQSATPALLGGLLRCGVCGKRMRRTYVQKRGRRFQSYVCGTYLERGAAACPGSRVPLARIESFVVEKIRAIGHDPSLLAETIATAKRQLEEKRPELDAELKKLAADSKRLGTERENILGAITHGGAGVPALVGRLGEIEEAIAKSLERESAVRAELAKTESDAIDEHDLRKALAEFDEIWAALFPAERARVMALLIEEIRFNAADKSVEIAFRPEGVRMLGQSNEKDTA